MEKEDGRLCSAEGLNDGYRSIRQIQKELAALDKLVSACDALEAEPDCTVRVSQHFVALKEARELIERRGNG